MITKLWLKNLKAWGEQAWADGIELAPVTLLLGPNSAGKTSLLQMPLVIKQTFASPDRSLDLNLGGQPLDLVDLGSYASLIHDHDTGRELGLGLTLRDGSATIDYRATYGVLHDAPVLQQLVLARADRRFAATRQARGGYLLEAPGYAPRHHGERLEARRRFQPERSLAFSAEAVAELGSLGTEVQDLALHIRQQVTRLAYLGPLRQRPERSYLWNGVEPGDLGSCGEYAVHALLASDNARQRQRPDEEGGHQWLVQRVSAWLARLGVADELTLERQGRSRHYELIVRQGRRRSNLADVGFGVSQVLPMLVLAHHVPPGTTIIAEQPELHLHPKAQVGLAELMVEVARQRRVQFLVETHSEHLFRRLQSLIADEALSPAACRLYAVDKGEDGETRLDRLEVDRFGRLRHWPRHFFGDTIGETERQTRRMLERLAQERGRQAE